MSARRFRPGPRAFAALLPALTASLALPAAPPARALDCYSEIAPSYWAAAALSPIQVDDDAGAVALGAALVDEIWTGEGFPTGLPVSVASSSGPPPGVDETALPNLDRIDSSVIALPLGFFAIAYHLHPTAANGRLVVAHQGHRPSFADSGLGDTLAFLLERGYAVIALMMPGIFPNGGPVSSHGALGALQSPSFHPLRIFLEPVAVALNHAEQSDPYDEFSMLGVSGGGWTTTLYAAVDPRIRRSFPVAGSLPLYLHEPPCALSSDWEQSGTDLYSLASYLDLYVLGGFGFGRQQLQILNQRDACCFFGISYQTYAPTVAASVRRLSTGRYDVLLDTSQRGRHEISPFAQVRILRELGEPVYAVDEDDAAAGLTGTWIVDPEGYAGGGRVTVSQPGSPEARWSFDDLPPGVYRVGATWPADPANTSSGLYEVSEGGSAYGAVALDQRQPPAGLDFHATAWSPLFELDVASGQLEVVLSNAGTGRLFADAVYAERTGDLPYPGPQDPDGDGVPSDGSGSGVAGDRPCDERVPLVDCDDNCPTLANPSQIDGDDDGRGDACDTCLDEPDAGQLDVDRDGYGNACDADFDNNHSVDGADFFRFLTSFGLSSGDPGFDPAVDSDGDGAVTGLEFLRFVGRMGAPPGPSGYACAGQVPCP